MYSYYSIFAHKKLLKREIRTGILQENKKCGILSLGAIVYRFMRSASPFAPMELHGNRLGMRHYTISLRFMV